MKSLRPALLLLTLLPSPLWAAELTANARVNIVEAVDMSTVSELNFGNISQLDGTCSMASSGVLTASDGQDCAGSSSPGIFEVAGTTGQSITLNVSAGGSVDGVSFTPKIDGALTRTLSGGKVSIEVIGDLTLSNATLGDKAIAYTVTANYQ